MRSGSVLPFVRHTTGWTRLVYTERMTPSGLKGQGMRQNCRSPTDSFARKSWHYRKAISSSGAFSAAWNMGFPGPASQSSSNIIDPNSATSAGMSAVPATTPVSTRCVNSRKKGFLASNSSEKR